MTVLIGVVVLFSATVSYSAFAIKLKNGRNIYAESYWIEGDHVHLQFKSGVMKIRKNEIQSITETKGRIPDEEESPRPPEQKPGEKPGEKPSVATKEEKPSAPLSGKEEIESYKNKKREIQKRLDEAKEVYFNTTNKDEKDKARKIMLSISNELFNLQEEVKKKNNGIIPKWWQEE